jgi:hypothetical protein
MSFSISLPPFKGFAEMGTDINRISFGVGEYKREGL